MLEMLQLKLQLYVRDRADAIKINEFEPKPQPVFLKQGRAKV